MCGAPSLSSLGKGCELNHSNIYNSQDSDISILFIIIYWKKLKNAHPGYIYHITFTYIDVILSLFIQFLFLLLIFTLFLTHQLFLAGEHDSHCTYCLSM